MVIVWFVLTEQYRLCLLISPLTLKSVKQTLLNLNAFIIQKVFHKNKNFILANWTNVKQ